MLKLGQFSQLKIANNKENRSIENIYQRQESSKKSGIYTEYETSMKKIDSKVIMTIQVTEGEG